MRTVQISGATGASSPETLRRARVEAAGVPASLAVTLLDLAFAVPKRDDLVMLSAITASRCSAASGARL